MNSPTQTTSSVIPPTTTTVLNTKDSVILNTFGHVETSPKHITTQYQACLNNSDLHVSTYEKSTESKLKSTVKANHPHCQTTQLSLNLHNHTNIVTKSRFNNNPDKDNKNLWKYLDVKQINDQIVMKSPQGKNIVSGYGFF